MSGSPIRVAMPIGITLDLHVTRFESGSTNCRRYSDNLQVGLSTDQYIHCNGIQQKLTDSDLGGEQ